MGNRGPNTYLPPTPYVRPYPELSPPPLRYAQPALPPQYINENNGRPLPANRQQRRQSQAIHIPVQAEYGEGAVDYGEVVLDSEALPVQSYAHEITQSVLFNPVTIVVAETGAGKSTQVPQILHKAGFDHVILTQPRRAAARNVFMRIKEEMGKKIGDDNAANEVSYRTAGEREGPEDARISVETDGLHLVKEYNAKGVHERDVLIIDEVHEWNSNIEVLVAWVKRAIAENSKLRVVLMSATMEANRLANYFAPVCTTVPPIIEVPGRSYTVERREEKDSTVVKEVVKAAIALDEQKDVSDVSKYPSNGILVFMPGKREIGDAIDEIRARLPADLAKKANILPLHAKLSPDQQQKAFSNYPDIKIIVATDVAQTSLTIPDVKYVIDSGLQRRMELDSEGVQGLTVHDISQADSDQRAGRAGRVSDGIYILTRLNDETKYVPFISREKFPTAEILRTDIVRNTLRVAAVGLDMEALDLVHPVDLQLISNAKETLKILGALDENGNITTLGVRMNEFPVCAQSARMMIEAERFSAQTQAYMAAIVAAKEVGGLQYFAYNVSKRWKGLVQDNSSDMLAQLELFIATQNMHKPRELVEYDLDVHNIERAREQYVKITKRVSPHYAHKNLPPPTDEEKEDIRQCILAGMVDSIYKHEGSGTYRSLGRLATVREISNRSTVTGHPEFVVGDPYRVVLTRRDEQVVKHILEKVTAAYAEDIGRAAVHLTEWRDDGLLLRGDNQFFQARRQFLGNTDLGVVVEAPAEPSPKLREVIIDHVVNSPPGHNQQKIRAIKKRLQELAHLAKDPVDQLTQDHLLSLIAAATPADATSAAIVDINLGIMQQDPAYKMTLDAYVSPERLARIIESAPETIDIAGEQMAVTYKRSKPLVRHYDRATIMKLKDEIFLDDGRQVYFVHGRKEIGVLELQHRLHVSNPAPLE